MSDNDNIYELLVKGTADEDRLRMTIEAHVIEPYLQEIAQKWIKLPVLSIFDGGCGSGQLASIFKLLYPEAFLIGLDKDPKAINLAHARYAGIPGMEFREGDLENEADLPYGPFDFAILSAVMPFMREPENLISRVYERLSPGGTLFIRDIDTDWMIEAVKHPSYREMARLRYWVVEQTGANLKISRELPEILTTAGFSSIHTLREVHPVDDSETGQQTLQYLMGGVLALRKRVMQLRPEITEDDYARWTTAVMTDPLEPSEVKYPVFVAQKSVE